MSGINLMDKRIYLIELTVNSHDAIPPKNYVEKLYSGIRLDK